MRLVLGLLMLSGLVGFAYPADQPPPKERAKQDTLKRLEGVWVLKSASVATPSGVGMAKLDAPNTPKQGLRIKDGVQEMTADGKLIPNGRCEIELGSEVECLHMLGRPGHKPLKVRFKIKDGTLIIVQDMLFKEECPESFDPEKGRDRGRRVLTFMRESQKP